MIRREHKTTGGSSGAIFSDCMDYRYLLWRTWDDSLPRALLLMMNPSTADEVQNDPTIDRQIRRVLKWPEIGFDFQIGGLEVANVFAYRETDSSKLPGLHDAGLDLIGPANDAMLVEAARRAAVVVCAWGVPGALGGRGQHVIALLHQNGITPYALQLNKNGTPKHPLYISYETKPIAIS